MLIKELLVHKCLHTPIPSARCDNLELNKWRKRSSYAGCLCCIIYVSSTSRGRVRLEYRSANLASMLHSLGTFTFVLIDKSNQELQSRQIAHNESFHLIARIPCAIFRQRVRPPHRVHIMHFPWWFSLRIDHVRPLSLRAEGTSPHWSRKSVQNFRIPSLGKFHIASSPCNFSSEICHCISILKCQKSHILTWKPKQPPGDTPGSSSSYCVQVSVPEGIPFSTYSTMSELELALLMSVNEFTTASNIHDYRLFNTYAAWFILYIYFWVGRYIASPHSRLVLSCLFPEMLQETSESQRLALCRNGV